MSSKIIVVLCALLVSLQVGVHAHHDALESSPLARRTHEAQRSLDSLPSHCSAGTTELILAEESRVTSLIETCPTRTIFLQISELLTDTSYFGFSLYNSARTLYSDFQTCVQEKCVFEKLFCFLEKSPGVAEVVVELALGTYSYILQVKDFLPKVISEIKECKSSTITSYEQFLEEVIGKAVKC